MKYNMDTHSVYYLRPECLKSEGGGEVMGREVYGR